MPWGAFYTENVSSDVWLHLGGIWYRPANAEAFANRRPNEEVVVAFSESLLSGRATVLPSGTTIEWESIPPEQAQLLPPPLQGESDA